MNHVLRALFRGTAAIASSALLLALAELCIHGQRVETWSIPLATYAFVDVATTIVLVLAHLGPAWLIVNAVSRKKYFAVFLLCGTAIVGLAWQHAVYRGGALSLRPNALMIRGGCVVLIPTGLVVFVRIVLQPSRLPLPWQRAIAATVLVGATCFDLLWIRPYEQFHGYLALANAALASWLLYPLFACRVATWLGNLLACSAIAILASVPQHQLAGRYVARYSRIPRSISWVSPVGKLLLRSDVPREWDVTCEACRTSTLPRVSSTPAPARGRNVVLIVLESTRWDYWSNPAVAPQFQRWKTLGVYDRHGIAAYSATVPAYASIFSGLPASVVLSSRDKNLGLMQALHRKLDRLILSAPDDALFPPTITARFAAGTVVHRHRDAADALAFLESGIEDAKGQSFLAWAHLYEPHAPYAPHGPGASDRQARYASEVSYVDAQLGAFIDWFRSRPEAQSTLLVVMADHGESLSDPLGPDEPWGHGYSVRGVETSIPIFYAGPGIPAGLSLADGSLSQLDFMPSVFEFVGTPLPSRYPIIGRSIYEALSTPPPAPLVSERWNASALSSLGSSETMLALHWRCNTLLADPALQQSLLYDSCDDPYELHERSRDDPTLARELEERLLDYIALERGALRDIR